jgi:hypothetical protein
MKMKQQACRAVGFTSSVVELEADTSQDALSRKINQHTTDASVDGTTPSLSLCKRLVMPVLIAMTQGSLYSCLCQSTSIRKWYHTLVCALNLIIISTHHHHHHSSSSPIGHRCHWRGQGRGRAAPYERRRVCAGNVRVWRMCCVARLTNVVGGGGGGGGKQ